MQFDWRDPVSLTPIGVVKSDFRDFSQPADYGATSIIVMREALIEGLTGIEHFSHIHVLYYQHRKSEWQTAMSIAQIDEQGLSRRAGDAPPSKGIWATRSPARGSGIGSCVVELIARDNNRLLVRGLDAFDGTAVLDIKVYIPRYDSVPMAVAPLHWGVRHGIATTSRMLHWDTMNVGLTLGLRAGQSAMKCLGLSRGEADHASVAGGQFFAQGIEGITGCSALRDTLDFTDKAASIADWSLRLSCGDRQVKVRLIDRQYNGADEVLSQNDEALFTVV